MFDLMPGNACILGHVVQWPTTKHSRSRQNARRNDGQLEGSIERVRLRIGKVVNFIQAKLSKARISQAARVISIVLRIAKPNLLGNLQGSVIPAYCDTCSAASTFHGIVRYDTSVAFFEQSGGMQILNF